MQHAMATLFNHFAVDRDRITVVGFADGVSYALGLSLANGDLFTRILAYSPGYIPPGRRDGRPTIFIPHGRRDKILPPTNTSHRRPDQLKQLPQGTALRKPDRQIGEPGDRQPDSRRARLLPRRSRRRSALGPGARSQRVVDGR
ncbi:hypothetical protein OG830_00365 [Streptomyces sp. NBC_00121]|uniref:hypothetical protein n=1 Tax=unclassified Streptomyces TaxID=2593676 RepID=UPI002DD88D4D|nr:hypothetical protein [Streptomyces sp. NBC_01760]WSC67036.1 hypothetical protein OG807_00385 [Streptomyces sp. NBC_01760]